jgi:hypothetical protein
VLVAVAVAALAAALALYLGAERGGARSIPLAVLRAVAWGSVGLLLLDPGCHRSGSATPPIVLLDASLSMSDPGGGPAGGPRWHAAVDRARAMAGARGHVLLFGAEPVALRPDAHPFAPASRLLPAWREAAALGGRISVVTDGEVDDARDLPEDFRATPVVVLPRRVPTDVGISGFDLPISVRAGDTVLAVVSLAAVGTAPGDTAMLELREGARVAARERVAVGTGGTMRRELRFVPAPPAAGAEREVRRYEARVSGIKADAEPRDDARTLVAEVSRASTIALFSDSPDWDFRTLVSALRTTSGVPVSAFVHLASGGPWRDALTLHPVTDGAVDAAARGAALVVAHGTPAGVGAILARARHSAWRWTVEGGPATAGDWYVASTDTPSPLGAALAGVPAESLPPLQAVGVSAPDTAAWVGLVAQLARRGRPRPVIVGSEPGGRRTVRVSGAGLWRWASQGGVALEGYRALTAAMTDWLLGETERRAPELEAERDSLTRGLDEYLPRPRTLSAQPGEKGAATGATVPARQSPWLYAAALAALMVEWIARRRRGMR